MLSIRNKKQNYAVSLVKTYFFKVARNPFITILVALVALLQSKETNSVVESYVSFKIQLVSLF